MAVDKNGKLYSEGDTVYLPGEVIEIMDDGRIIVKLDTLTVIVSDSQDLVAE